MKNGISLSARHGYLSPIVVPFVLPTSVYGAMLVIWHLRPALQKVFPLHQGRAWDYVRFLAWCAIEGRRDYAILRTNPEWDSELSQPIALPVLEGDTWRDGFSVLMFFHAAARQGYTFEGVLHQAETRHDAARAFWRGKGSTRPASPTAWQRGYLARKFGTMDGLVQALRLDKRDAGKANAQLVEELELSQLGIFPKTGRESDGRTLEPGTMPTRSAHLPPPSRAARFSPVRELPGKSLDSVGAGEKPSEFHLAAVTRFVPVTRKRPPVVEDSFGVNIIGAGKGESGEEMRVIALALQAGQIPFCVVEARPGETISEEDGFLEDWVAEKPRYGINLLCLTGTELARLACEKGVENFAGRYNIGLSRWELSQWPSSCHYTHGMVDEIWGASEHTTRSFLNAPRPVFAMSPPVAIDAIAEMNRGDFGLPGKPYLFVAMLDIHSSLARQNPLGIIRAFQKAFPRESGEEVGLVLKINAAAPASATLSLLRQYAEGDRRIHIVARAMARSQELALSRACDCFVTLHRAEGFGRHAAEALLLNLQVIATGFSGTMDFCAEPRVGLVSYEMRPVQPEEHAWSDGQMWAEPDIEHAAELMRDIRKTPRKTDFDFDFSPETVGRRYAQRLRKIQKELHLADYPALPHLACV